MATAKVILNGTTLMDVTADTVNTTNLLTGETATKNDGTSIVGAYVVPTFYSITKTLTNVTTSNDDSTVVAGNSFYMDLTPANNYVISTITVTMGGVDITDQVFKAGNGEKAISANGTYNASNDDLGGYSRVVVAIPAYNGEIVTTAYNVTVSLTNPNYPSNFISCDIYKLTELGQDPGDVMISQISSPTGSATVSVNDGDMIGIAFDANYVTYSGVVTVSGGVSYLGAYGTAVQYYAFSVTGDGTITIDGMDYED